MGPSALLPARCIAACQALLAARPVSARAQQRAPRRSLLAHHRLLPLLLDFLQPGAVDDDILLEVRRWAGALPPQPRWAGSARCAALERSTARQPPAQAPCRPPSGALRAQVVMFIGTVAGEATAPLLAAAGIVPALVALMGAKRADDELVLQLAFACLRLLGQPATRAQLLGDAQVRAAPGRVRRRGLS